MLKYSVRTYNNISPLGLAELSGKSYVVGDDVEKPEAIILRSHKLETDMTPGSVLAIARAGAGVNNIPVADMTERGVVVFNTPGANANAVKELVVAGMLLASRNLIDASSYVKSLKSDDQGLPKLVESGKQEFQGFELANKTLGVIGMGAIGYRVANLAIDLGMKVIGYDPAITVGNAWQVSSAVEHSTKLDELLKSSDFVTIHVPLIDATRGLIGQKQLAKMKSGSTLLNFSRDQIVDEKAVIAALDANKLGKYVSDFPNNTTYAHRAVIALPHLGASTKEAEDNCAVMAADQLRDFLENGNIRNSVNFPSVSLARGEGVRLTIAHKNQPGMLSRFTNTIAEFDYNVAAIINNNHGHQAYTVVDLDTPNLDDDLVKTLKQLDQVQTIRVLPKLTAA